MDIKPLSPNYAVSPQITVEDIPSITQAGYTTIICNRPDSEIPPSHQASAIAAAAKLAGVTFVEIPVTHQSLNLEIVAEQGAAIAAADGPVLAYCASGTRSSIVWSLAMASDMPSEQIIAATTEAGYDLSGLRGQLDTIAAQAKS